jgi:hypothetical protein
VKSSGDRNEKYRQRYREAVQQHLSEPLLAVGVFNRPGGIQAIGMAKVSPLLSMVMRKSAKKQAGGLPTTVALAITPTRVHVFGFNARSSSIETENELMAWDRRGLQVQTQQTMTATRLQLTPEGGDTIELEWLKMAGDFNDEAVQALSQPVS